MLEIGVLKNFDSGTYKAGVQLAGSLTTYFDDIPVAKNIPSSALVIGNYVILAIPGGNPKDACVIASWPGGSSGSGMEVHGNEYHDPDFAAESALATHEAASTAGVHGSTSAATANKLVHRDASGRAKVAAPSASDDIARKAEVDAKPSTFLQLTDTPSSYSGQAGKVAKVKATEDGLEFGAGGGGGGSKIQDADGDTSWDTEQSADEDKVRGKVKGVEAFLLDDAGVLTLAKQSSVRAYKSTAQSIPSGTFTKLNLNAENWDIQSEFDTTNYRFTAKTAGKYLVTAAIWYAATTMVVNKYYQINLYKNGANEASGRFHSACAGEYLCAPLSVVVSLAVNDYLELYAHQGSGVTQTIEAGFIHCWFCVTKLT